MHWHPMELLPYFRRWKRSVLRDIFYTFLWNNLFSFIVGCISLGFSDPGPMGRFLWVQFVMTQCVGFSIHGLFDLLGLLFNRWLSVASSAVRTVYYMVVPTAGIFVGYWIGFGLLNMHAARAYVFSARGAWGVTVFALIIAGLLCIAFITRDRQRQSEVTLANERQRTLDAERRALEAQLRMLQAQIEPHFLYNTLANAVGLIAPAPDKARLLLERLIDYLRASLTESREKEIRLGRELDTIRAYLDLMTVRMGDRLRYRIDCPAELSQQPMAPMLLQPLVENAIQHGLEPKIEGGEVMLTVQRDGSALRIDVVDTGTGFDPSARPRPGGGIGLSNLRERLATLYGGNAQLSLADNLGGGVKASLRLPIAG
jgi:signal transduction histidine kinase